MTNAKLYLREIRTKKQYLDRLKTRRAALHLNVSFGGIDYSADRVQSTPQNKMENALMRLSERMEYLDEKIAEVSMDIDNRLNAIEAIDDGSDQMGAYRMILFKHYAECKSLEEIAIEMMYSYNYTCNLHGDALAELQKVLNLS